jgi:hypothetical protein
MWCIGGINPPFLTSALDGDEEIITDRESARISIELIMQMKVAW